MTEKTQLLFEWGDPRKREKSRSYREWDDYLHHGFSDADIPDLIELMHDEKLINAYSDTNEVWVPIYAWRILGQLRNPDAVEPLIEASKLFDEFDDWSNDEIPVALGMIGKPALPALSDVLLDDAAIEHVRIIASDGLKEVVHYYPELRDEVLDEYRGYLLAPDLNSPNLNGLLVADLLSLKAVELIEEIRDLYAKNCVKLMICGDIEEVEIDLGLRTERSTPKPDYGYPKFEELRELLEEYKTNMREENAHLQHTGKIPPETYVRETAKVGRNDPCPCGSGKKYKRCCL